MCACEPNRVCGPHVTEISGLYSLLRDAEQRDTGMQEPLRRAIAEYGPKADIVILAVEASEVIP